jgi:hypothetical protein
MIILMWRERQQRNFRTTLLRSRRAGRGAHAARQPQHVRTERRRVSGIDGDHENRTVIEFFARCGRSRREHPDTCARSTHLTPRSAAITDRTP